MYRTYGRFIPFNCSTLFFSSSFKPLTKHCVVETTRLYVYEQDLQRVSLQFNRFIIVCNRVSATEQVHHHKPNLHILLFGKAAQP